MIKLAGVSLTCFTSITNSFQRPQHEYVFLYKQIQEIDITENKKTKIIKSEMTPSMEKDAVKIAKEGFKNNDKGEAILHIIHTMNQRYGEQWNCVIGHSATAVNSVHGTRVVFKLAGVR